MVPSKEMKGLRVHWQAQAKYPRIPLQYIGNCLPAIEIGVAEARMACSKELTSPAAIKVTRLAITRLQARGHLYAENGANRKQFGRSPQNWGHTRETAKSRLNSLSYTAICMPTRKKYALVAYCSFYWVRCRNFTLGTFSYSPHVMCERFWVWFCERGVDVAAKGSEVEQIWCGTRATRAATPKP
jgi:hypothetical protein